MDNSYREDSKLRKGDVQGSNIVSEYLDTYFYPKYVTDFKRVNELESQYKGIDCSFTLNDKKYICDEKAAVQYINKPLRTFALELSFIDKLNSVHNGWLIDGEKINNSFLFIWIDMAKYDYLTDKDDILMMEIALLDRLNIIDYLKSNGWTSDKLFLKMKRIRENINENLGNLYRNNLKFTISKHLVEQPINVLISREQLIELSDFHITFQ